MTIKKRSLVVSHIHCVSKNRTATISFKLQEIREFVISFRLGMIDIDDRYVSLISSYTYPIVSVSKISEI